ncbi:hypothetical protein FRC01_005620 [Tulasnella sp. 417]|nr:hypothetical protein FRC01_005620 [Tulasnella sp. 417]
MNRYNSARPPNHRRVPYSPASSDGPGLVRQADRLAVPSFQRSRSRRFQTAGSSQPEDAVAGVNRRSLDRPVGLVEDTAEGHITPVGIHGLSKSGSPCPSAETLPKFGYSGDSVSQGSAPLTHRIHGTPSGSSKRDGRAIGPGVKLSAAGGAEPSSSVAPSRSPALLRKPRKVKAVSKSCVPHPAHRQSGSLVSRISSSLREWGNTASRLFTFRPSAKVEENGSFSPYIDPWERFVPSRGPSPEYVQTVKLISSVQLTMLCIRTAPDDDPASSESKIWNIYVKLDEAM